MAEELTVRSDAHESCHQPRRSDLDARQRRDAAGRWEPASRWRREL